MSFEHFEPESESREEGPKESSFFENLAQKAKKAVALGALGASLFANEGKAAEPGGERALEKDRQHEIGGKLHEQYKAQNELHQKIHAIVSSHEASIREGKIDFAKDPFLASYYELIDTGSVKAFAGYDSASETTVETEGLKVRVLEIASKNGIKLDLQKGLNAQITAEGNVPVKAIINGVEVPIHDSDLTEKERASRSFARSIRSGGASLEEAKKETPSAAKPVEAPKAPATNNVKTSPDFDKDGNF